MSDFRQLSEHVMVSPQISPADIADAAALGVTLIINNRPDGETPDQTPGAQIEQAARDAGIEYVAIPVSSAGFSLPQVDAMRQALDQADGKVLAYCRSGTRSTFLWSLAQADAGADVGKIADSARQAGYDISPIGQTLQMLASKSGG